MQLDRTAIAIRERGMMEILDLALHVIRNYLGPITCLAAIGVFPFFVINRLLLGWLVQIDARDYSEIEYSLYINRYVFTLALLVTLQAPMATALIVTWLGRAVFGQRISIAKTIKETLSVWGTIMLCQGLLRCSVTATVLVWLIIRTDWESAAEVPLLSLMVLAVGMIRAVRPFLLEIILLERNPLQARQANTITIGKRNSALHSSGSGTLFFLFLGSALIAICLCGALFYTMLFFQGVMLNSWRMGPSMLLYALPLCMWVCVVIFTVFRFLCYLDLRIRQEGWAVELKMRAEAAKLHGHVHAT